MTTIPPGVSLTRDYVQAREFGTMWERVYPVVFADDTLGLDGVWWEDDYDGAYSAPRGVIFVSRLPEWTVEPAEEWPEETF